MNKKSLIISSSCIVVILLIIFLIVSIIEKNNHKEDGLNDEFNCSYKTTSQNDKKYEKGNYTYSYITINYEGKDYTGWEVNVTDKDKEYIDGRICKTINGDPIISANNMFQYSNANEIDITNFDTSSILFMQSMFRGTTAKVIKGIENMDTSKVMNMSNMFAETNIENLNLTKFNTDNVTNMMFMFSGAKIKNLDLTSFNTQNVKYIDGIFLQTEAESIDISNWDISKLTQVKDFFYGCTAKINFGNEEQEKKWHDLMYKPKYD